MVSCCLAESRSVVIYIWKSKTERQDRARRQGIDRLAEKPRDSIQSFQPLRGTSLLEPNDIVGDTKERRIN